MHELKEKICEMRLLISVNELEYFKKEFPDIEWTAGDTKISWNANKPEEVEMARKAYEAYKKKHPKAEAFGMDKDDKKNSKSLDGFDPNAEVILIQDWAVKG